MAKLTTQEIAARMVASLDRAKQDAKRPERVAATAAVRRMNAILERRARKF